MSDLVREQSKRGAEELDAARAFFGGSDEIQPDKQGRVALPPNLREYAGLERDVVVAGVFSRIEIWDRSGGRSSRRSAVPPSPSPTTCLTSASDAP